MTFRTRQAPSPTGYLHLGTARIILYTKLLAKKKQGVYFLRIDDTDQKRLVSDAVYKMMEAVGLLGLLPDEGVTNKQTDTYLPKYQVWSKGNLGPYAQSDRLNIYHTHAQNMLDKKIVYWSYLTSEQRAELQNVKQSSKKPINWFEKSFEQVSENELYASIEQGLKDSRKPVLRYRLQRQSILECEDQLLGVTKFNLSLEEDPVFLKSDGFPTYHLAHLVDDHLMQTSLVIRGQEWFPSLPMHQQSFIDYWGKEKMPDYMHLPVILSEQGNKKMSKRDGNVNVKNDYLDKGYLPEAIINYLAFLGWNPGTDKELYLSKEDF